VNGRQNLHLLKSPITFDPQGFGLDRKDSWESEMNATAVGRAWHARTFRTPDIAA